MCKENRKQIRKKHTQEQLQQEPIATKLGKNQPTREHITCTSKNRTLEKVIKARWNHCPMPIKNIKDLEEE